MAPHAQSAVRVQSATTTSGDVDVVTLGTNKWYSSVRVTNREATNLLWVRTDGTDPVAGADEVDVVMPGQTVTLTNRGTPPVQGGAAPSTVVRILGSDPALAAAACKYTCAGI